MRRPALFATTIALLVAAGCMLRQEEAPLVRAARDGDVTAIRTLTARGANPDQAGGANGWPPLLHAVHKNQLDAAAALLDGGANVNATTPSGMTPLMMAAGYGNDAMVRLLLARGANCGLRDADGEAAVDYALSGVTDLDAFTFFRCQSSTARLLQPVSPPPTAASRRWSSLKRCA
jgi:ankyrin repeat protein